MRHSDRRDRLGVLTAQGAGYVIAGLAVIVALRGHAVTADHPAPGRYRLTALGPRPQRAPRRTVFAGSD